ncbi:MAG: LamG-like jellyroll fold domain-containing protein [Caldilineaceae bacterium]
MSAAVGMAAFPPRHGSTGQTLVVDGNSDNSVYSIKTGFDHSGNQTNIVFRAESDFGLDNVTVELIKDANSFPLRNASFTLSAWAKAENANQGGLLIAQGPDEPHQGLRFGFSSSDVYCGFTDNGLAVPLTLDTDWHHWVCTFDAATKTRTLYRDGVQIGQNTAPANYSGYGPTYIGQGFVGAIDEVGIWTEALDADEIKELFEKVKVEDQSVLTCQLPVATNTGTLSFQGLTLRETTTRIGDISQTVTRTITVDNDLPVVQIQTPSNGQYVSGDDIVSIAGAATDATSYVGGVQVRSDSHGGTWVDTARNANWSYNWDPSGQSEGRHTVTVQAVDAVGNESAAQSVEFVLDKTAPTVWAVSAVQPTQDAAGHWYVPLSGNVSDPNAGSEPGSGVAAVEVLLQGQQETSGNGWQAATFSGDTWTLDYILPRIGDNRQVIVDPSGVYTVTLRGTDNVDNITPAASYPHNPSPWMWPADADRERTGLLTEVIPPP